MPVTSLAPLLRPLGVTFDPAARTATRADGQVLNVHPAGPGGGLTLELSGTYYELMPAGPGRPECPDPLDSVTRSGLDLLSGGDALTALGLRVDWTTLHTPRGPLPLRHTDHAPWTFVRLGGRWYTLRHGPHLVLSTLRGVLETTEQWTMHAAGPLHVAVHEREILVDGAVLTRSEARDLAALLSAT